MRPGIHGKGDRVDGKQWGFNEAGAHAPRNTNGTGKRIPVSQVLQ